MSNPEYERANQLLRRAISEKLIDPNPLAIQRLVFGGANQYKALMETVTAQRKQVLDSPWLGQQASWQLPTTRRYHQSRSPSEYSLTQPDANLNWMAEVARFPVPFGSVGIIKSLEQYVAQDDITWSESERWGNPFPLSTSIRWYLRLSHVSLVGNPWINVSGLSAIPDYLPGTPYDDFERSTGIWFPSGSSSSSNIHLPIPGGQVLRMVCLIEASQTTPFKIAVKLTGTVQSETNEDAQYVVRRSW